MKFATSARISIWGVVFAMCGGVLREMNSYDTTGHSALEGALGGFVFGVLLGIVINFLTTKARRPR